MITLEMVKLFLLVVGQAALAAAIAAGIGYVKAHFGPDKEPFDLEKFLEVVLTGVILGAAAGAMGISVLAVQDIFVSLGLMGALSYIVHEAAVAIYRFLMAKVFAKPAPVQSS